MFFLFVCFLDSKVYSRIFTFTPVVLNLLTFQGLPSYSPPVHPTGLTDTESSHMLSNTHSFSHIVLLLFRVVFYFAFLLHEDDNVLCIYALVTWKKPHVLNFESICQIINIDAISISLVQFWSVMSGTTTIKLRVNK